MIKKCKASDALSQLDKREDANHFLLLYIKNFEEGKHYELYKANECYILYIFSLIVSISYAEHLSIETVDFIKSLNFRMLIASNLNAEELKDIDRKETKIEKFMAIKREDVEIKETRRPLLTLQEYKALYFFYKDIKEFENYYSERDILKKREKMDKKNFAFAHKVNNEIVSALFLNDGLIASVATKDEFRKRGYARENILSALSYYFSNNIDEDNAYLFYTKEEIGSYYRKIGFKDINGFVIIKR